MTSILKVTEIQDPTNSNTALEIDSSGRVILPARPFVSAAWDASSVSSGKFTAYNTSDTNLVHGGGPKIYYHNDFNMLNTSTGIVTVPTSGIYIISGCYSDGTGSANRRIGQFWINDVSQGEWVESYGQYDDVSVTRILKLTADDEIKFGHGALAFDGFGFEMVFLG